MHILPFRALTPNNKLIPDLEHFFKTVKEDFNQFLKLQYFSPPREPALYVFRVQNDLQKATGLICATQVEDYLKGNVLKHETTIHKKEQVQISLLQKRNAAVKPVLIVHRKVPEIQQWINQFANTNQPILQFEFAGEEKHLLWEVNQKEDQQQIQDLFRNHLSWAAIADGHHRFSSFASLWKGLPSNKREKYHSVLSAYFPEDELCIDAFHRIVVLPKGCDVTVLVQQIGQLGTLQPMEQAKLPDQKHQMSIFTSSGWYHFAWDRSFWEKDTTQLPILDVDLLFRNILQPLLKINNPQDNPRLHYLEGGTGTEELSSFQQNLFPSIGFALSPIPPEDFLRAASSGYPLVPKATFFRPRLKNGLIVQTLNNEVV